MIICVFSENRIRLVLSSKRIILVWESFDKLVDGKPKSISNESKSLFFVIWFNFLSNSDIPLFVGKSFCCCSSRYIDPTSENVSDDASGAKWRRGLSTVSAVSAGGVAGKTVVVSMVFIGTSKY